MRHSFLVEYPDFLACNIPFKAQQFQDVIHTYKPLQSPKKLSNPRCLEQMSTKVSLLNTKLNHMKRPPGNALGRWGTTLDTAKRQQVELIVKPTSDAVFGEKKSLWITISGKICVYRWYNDIWLHMIDYISILIMIYVSLQRHITQFGCVFIPILPKVSSFGHIHPQKTDISCPLKRGAHFIFQLPTSNQGAPIKALRPPRRWQVTFKEQRM